MSARPTTRSLPWLPAPIRPRLGRLRQHSPRALAVARQSLSDKPPHPAPRISLVTPSLDQGQFLERTLQSVLEQRYPALEYLVQDGGSTDQSKSILARYDHLLAHYASAMDTGQADALNRAFRLTTGEIMGYLNSDDLLLPGSLAYVSRFFADNASIDVIYGHRMLVDENDCLIGSWVMPSHSSRALRLADYIPQETLFWRRRIWNAVGESFATHLAYALDWELLLRFQTAGARIVRVPRFLGAFRVHPGQKSTHENSRRLTEEAELRRNLHARTLSEREVLIRLAPYLARHLAAHVRERLAAAMRTDDVTLWVTDDHEVPDAERQP